MISVGHVNDLERHVDHMMSTLDPLLMKLCLKSLKNDNELETEILQIVGVESPYNITPYCLRQPHKSNFLLPRCISSLKADTSGALLNTST
jgi:hypothetical protein